MKYTFEVSIAGCNTQCAHCYVSGGKAPVMAHADYLFAICYLKEVFDGLGGDISLTIGNEIFNHPNIADIITQTHDLMPEHFSYNGFAVPTTGIALMNREDRGEIVAALKQAGCTQAMLTLHGNQEHQTFITKNRNSFRAVIAAAAFFRENGITPRFNLMLNKYLVADWAEIVEVLAAFHDARKSVTIPLYMPVKRLRDFQTLRASYEDCLALYDKLDLLGIDGEDFREEVESFNDESVRGLLLKEACFDYAEQERKSPQWAFFHLDRRLDLFYGNVGAGTMRLGSIKTTPAREMAEKIKGLPANYDWSAFYDVEELPKIRQLLAARRPDTSNLVYPSINDCIYRWLDEINHPSILLPMPEGAI